MIIDPFDCLQVFCTGRTLLRAEIPIILCMFADSTNEKGNAKVFEISKRSTKDLIRI